MVDLIETRMSKLAQMSDHYRRLADNLEPNPASAEIVAVADEFDNVVVRMERECVGVRICTCELRGSCLVIADVEAPSQRRAA